MWFGGIGILGIAILAVPLMVLLDTMFEELMRIRRENGLRRRKARR